MRYALLAYGRNDAKGLVYHALRNLGGTETFQVDFLCKVGFGTSISTFNTFILRCFPEPTDIIALYMSFLAQYILGVFVGGVTLLFVAWCSGIFHAKFQENDVTNMCKSVNHDEGQPECLTIMAGPPTPPQPRKGWESSSQLGRKLGIPNKKLGVMQDARI